MKILVTGSNGQLGSEIKDLANKYNESDFFFRDLPNLDICDLDQLNKFIHTHMIDCVINCAAYTDVEKAELNTESAENINSNGVLNLLKVLKKVNGKLIQISTDYVFDGKQTHPYNELDPVNPIGVYGKTKRLGELKVINSEVDAIVIRTSWLYSSYGENFVKTMLRLGLKKKELSVVSDQQGTPTYAKDLAKVCLDILCSENQKIISENGKLYHYSNDGVVSWFEFANEIMKLRGVKCKILPILSRDYPSITKRPHYSVLDKTKIKEDFNIRVAYWKDSLKECIIALSKN